MPYRSVLLTLGVSLLSLAAMQARAECTTSGCNDVYVKQLYADAVDTHFWVETTGTETSLNCTPASGVLLKVAADSKQVFALLLSAQLADKVVRIRVNEGTNPCTVAYVTLDRQ
jgi:hypothetical protein